MEDVGKLSEYFRCEKLGNCKLKRIRCSQRWSIANTGADYSVEADATYKSVRWSPCHTCTLGRYHYMVYRTENKQIAYHVTCEICGCTHEVGYRKQKTKYCPTCRETRRRALNRARDYRRGVSV